jgi:tetratricopeptide (TPR) repeat protein
MPACDALLTLALLWAATALSGEVRAQAPAGPDRTELLDLAQDAFYNARYDEASAYALEQRTADPGDLAAYELRTSALLFQLKRLLGDDKRRIQKVDACVTCRPLLDAFADDVSSAQALARTRLETVPEDLAARFYLGKVNLNHVWLHLGPLGRRTGWKEYREARESLDSVLTAEPEHVRALVARAWIDYIVDTRMPWGTKWLFGGGSRDRALTAVRKAVATDGDFYARVEARFALWEMLVRENDLAGATAVARDLARDFPGNPELIRFVAAHEGGAS